jgi:hypothetical protein
MTIVKISIGGDLGKYCECGSYGKILHFSCITESELNRMFDYLYSYNGVLTQC